MKQRIRIPSFLQYCPVPVLKGPARGKWWTLYPYSAYWRLGGHEPEMDAAIDAAGDLRGKVAWDMGAHFGIYSLVLACLVGDRGQVAAFEPDSVSYSRLEKHMAMNQADNVVTFNAAASDVSGESFIVVDTGAGSTTSHLLYQGEQTDESTKTQRIECLRADDLVEAGRIKCPDLIKLDVEGHGAQALQGGAKSIASSLPCVVASTHSSQEVEGIRRVLEPLGYTVESFANGRLEKSDWSECTWGRNYVFRCGKM